MDQNAFRSLLSAPREGQASSSRAVLGKHAPRRGGAAGGGGGGGGGGAWGIKPKEGKVYEKPKEEVAEPAAPTFAPRTHRKLDSRYKDRAEMRRQGVDDEYKGVEKLLEDFEKRKATATEDELAEIEKQRQYLGGDAEHSILVKGLDFGLLAARKAELAREKEEDVDDELDELGKGMGGKKSTKPSKVGVTATTGESSTDAGASSRFKSIGEKGEANFKSIGAGGGEEVKKKKKKKKKAVESTDDMAKGETKEEVKIEEPVASSSKLPLPPPSAKQPPPKAPEPVVDDDEDIFADAGTYDLNIAVDEDESEGSEAARDVDDELMRNGRTRGRSRSRAGSRSRSRSRSRSYNKRRSRSYDSRDSRDRGYHRSRSRSRSRSYDSREPEYRENRGRREDYSTGRNGRYRSRSRSRSYDDRRYPTAPPRRRGDYRPRSRSRSRGGYSRRPYRSPSPRYGYTRDRRRSRSRSYTRSPSPRYSTKRARRDSPGSRSPSPAPRRQRTRSLTPPLFNNPIPLSPRSPRRRSSRSSGSPGSPGLLRDPYDARGSPSPTPSDESDMAGQVLGGKLVPLAGSAMSDVKSFLASAQGAAEAEEKKMRKAQWRLKQGLSLQEGVTADMVNEFNRELDRRKDEAAERGESSGRGGRGGRGGGGRGGGRGAGGKAESGESREDRRKAQREYQLIMNKMNKEGGGGGGKGGGDGEGGGGGGDE